MFKFPMGSKGRWLAARNQSRQALHGVVAMRCYVGWGHAICLLCRADCQWPLLHLHDGDIRLARECCRLWVVW